MPEGELGSTVDVVISVFVLLYVVVASSSEEEYPGGEEIPL